MLRAPCLSTNPLQSLKRFSFYLSRCIKLWWDRDTLPYDNSRPLDVSIERVVVLAQETLCLQTNGPDPYHSLCLISLLHSLLYHLY